MKSPTNIVFCLMLAAAVLLAWVLSARAADAGHSQTKRSKEVLKREGGKDRHWLIKSNKLIVEEHGLTAHGDLHLMVEYSEGVQTPQIDATSKDTNAPSVATMFWPNGKRMSRTPAIGGAANGQDLLWWPNGKLFRQADFVMGIPTGVWKYWDQKGKFVGEGTYNNGKRQKGVFVGDDRSGLFFFFTSYPMKLQSFENGVLKEEHDFLKELKMR